MFVASNVDYHLIMILVIRLVVWSPKSPYFAVSQLTASCIGMTEGTRLISVLGI